MFGGYGNVEPPKPITDPYDISITKDLGATSYQRRWIINNDELVAQKKLRTQITQMSYYPDTQPPNIDKIMDPFWKQLTENKLLPLTTSFGHQHNYAGFNNTKRYQTEDNYLDKDQRKKLTENLCLRLT